jgi:hypothetical protein
MAVGLGLLLGVRLPMNFDSPFQAESPAELWRRWHMTLSRWMRDYVYYPLGGSRRGYGRTLLHILIVFLLIGLWHGANEVFILWGLYHGLVICAHSLARRAGIRLRHRGLNRLLVFVYFTLGGFFFRAGDLETTRSFLAAATGKHGLLPGPGAGILLLLALMTIHTQLAPNSWQWKWRWGWWEAVGLALLLAAVVMRMSNTMPFFYFQL